MPVKAAKCEAEGVEASSQTWNLGSLVVKVVVIAKEG